MRGEKRFEDLLPASLVDALAIVDHVHFDPPF